ncbi:MULTISPECIES: serine hydrolase [Halomonas]|uniref:serine hydrolase n=1 Tax=Halomonas TaxID=2745 RepID=UPI001D011ADB|nr:serine hydrolase [Halomonas citrativorans]
MQRQQRWLLAIVCLMALPAYADGTQAQEFEAQELEVQAFETNWYYEVDKQSTWQADLNARVAAIEGIFEGTLGVYVQNLATGEAYSWHADRPWYLASLVKVPIAAQVLAERQSGTLSLDERLTLSRGDFVDGAGPVIWHDPGTPISIRYLLEQMITVSDNTASDMLIDRVGLADVNIRARAMIADSGGNPDDIGPISKLVGVRQGVYGQLHPDARTLDGMDFIALRQHRLSQRAAALAQRLDVDPSTLKQPDYDHAFDAYEATGENVGTLRAYGDLLASVYKEAASGGLGAQPSQALLEIMQRTTSGSNRLTAGLGDTIRFAHKTGTQHRRSCDAGIASHEEANGPWVIVACSRGPVAVNDHERALARVGDALRYSGALGKP